MGSKSGKSEDYQLLDSLVRSVPTMDAPPFFASRVAYRAFAGRNSFAGSVQSWARRLVPVAMSMSILACIITYQLSGTEVSAISYSELLFENEEMAESITVEYVLDSIGPLSVEDEIVESRQ